MPDAATLRDSTEILLPHDTIDDVREEIDERFTLTVFREETHVRLVGSPVEIKKASDYLARNGISVR